MFGCKKKKDVAAEAGKAKNRLAEACPVESPVARDVMMVGLATLAAFGPKGLRGPLKKVLAIVTVAGVACQFMKCCKKKKAA